MQYKCLRRELQSEKVYTLKQAQQEANSIYQFQTFYFDNLPDEILVSLHRGNHRDRYCLLYTSCPPFVACFLLLPINGSLNSFLVSWSLAKSSSN